MNKLLIAVACVCLAASAPRPACAISVTFDNAFTITDNMPGFDFNSAVGVIDFDSVSSGPLTASGYEVKGTVTALAGGNTYIMANATSVLTLTNFVADTGSATPGQSVTIDFSEAFTAAGTVNAVDAIDAQVANGFGQATFANGSTSSAVPFGNDTIDNWYGYVSGQLIVSPVTGGPLPLLNPTLPAGGGTLPYALYGHGPQPMGFFSPTVGGHLEFTLRGTRDQLVLPSSAQVGFWVVPEPSSWALLGMGSVALVAWRRRAARVGKA